MKVNESLLKKVVQIAKLAGYEIIACYDKKENLEIKTKQDNSPVTIADYKAHEIIARHLLLLTPSIPILSEEDNHIPYEIRKKWTRFWLVDPLDGTQKFIHRNGPFTVNIALVENSIPILGVIFAPLKNEFYFAARGVGAYKMIDSKKALPLHVRSWHRNHDIIMITTRKELHEELRASLMIFGNIKMTYLSGSLKFCFLAEGSADIYLRKKPIHEWDTAAGQCILEEAGGIVLDLNWKPLRYNTKSHLLNPPFIALGDSKQLLSILKKMPIAG
jgi:3'(2'), 5'-bisphosphate nucleotidase